MIVRVISIFFYLLGTHVSVLAILDGRVNPIYLETQYTFSNYEWARGMVLFKKGFTLPLNGTVILDIVEPVQGNILFHNSKLTLHNDLDLAPGSSISGVGSLDLRNHRIRFSSDQIFNAADRFIVFSRGQLAGAYNTVIQPGNGLLEFKDGLATVLIRNLILKGPTTTNFVIDGPGYYVFDNVNFILDGTLELNIRFLTSMLNTITIQGTFGSIFQINEQLRIDSYADIFIKPGIIVKAGEIGSDEPTGGILLENSTLEYLATATSKLMFVNIYGPGFGDSGKLTIRGPSTLKSQPQTTLLLQSDSRLVMEAGARLKLDDNTHLRVY